MFSIVSVSQSVCHSIYLLTVHDRPVGGWPPNERPSCNRSLLTSLVWSESSPSLQHQACAQQFHSTVHHST